MFGLIRYIKKVPQAIRSPYDGIDFYKDLATADSPLVPTGSAIDIYLDMGYQSKDRVRDDNRAVNRTPSEFTQVISLGLSEGERITLQGIARRRDPNFSNDYEVFRALNNHLSRAGVVQWYEDYDDDPDNFQMMIAKRIYPEKRLKKQEMFDFTYELWPLAAGQVARNVPAITAPGDL